MTFNWNGGWFGVVSSGSGGDSTAPTVAVVSPSSPSGFDPTYSTARVTPIVIDVTDAAPGLGTVIILTGAELVFYGTPTGAYESAYVGSSTSAITHGTRFTILPSAGWPSGVTALTVIAIDGDGNLTRSTFTWSIAAAAVDQNDEGVRTFRDSVWRWRRRLARKKCSVISVAIEDSYSSGPGFTLTALALEIGRKKGLDRSPWRGGTYTNTSGSGSVDNGN